MNEHDRGPISWQQAARVRHETHYGKYANMFDLYELPDFISNDEVLRRLSDFARREEALSITDAAVYDGGHSEDGWVTYAPEASLPVQSYRCDSRAEALKICEEIAGTPFERDGGLLWRFLTFEYLDASGKTVRAASHVLDHMVCDGRSMHLLKQQLTGAVYPGVRRYRGSYRQWAAWSREKYRHVPGGPSSPVREFWLRMLDGAEADAASAIPFAIPTDRPFSGLSTRVHASAAVSLAQLSQAGRRLRATPFLLVVAAAVAALAEAGPVDDLMFRMISSGRPVPYLNTHGWFADSLPMRLRGPALEDTQSVLRQVVPLWARMMRYQDTPWDYIRTACSPSSVPVGAEAGVRQLLVNFTPFESAPVEGPIPAEIVFPAYIESLHLMVNPVTDGRCQIWCTFNADHFITAEAQRFTSAVAGHLARLAAQVPGE
jgi:hypothetical protein